MIERERERERELGFGRQLPPGLAGGRKVGSERGATWLGVGRPSSSSLTSNL